nr:hypothetical protein LTR18_011101 [Exophiala xenobiotica]
MSAVNARIQGIEDSLKKLLDVVDKHGSPGRHRSAKSRKPSQPPWETIRSIVDRLAQDIQSVKEMVEGSGSKTGHDRSMGADDRNATPNDPLQILDQPPHGEQIVQNSSETAQCTRNDGPIYLDPSANADRSAAAMPLLSGLGMDENRAPATPISDQFCTIPTTVPTTVPTNVESSEVEENTALVVTMPHRSSHPIMSTISQSATSAQSVSEVPRNLNITIPYREEQGVVVLMPLNMDQCRDTPFLLSQAEALGARETGIFKYVLPDDFDFSSAHTVLSVATRVSRFTSRLGQDDILRISRAEALETLDIGDTSFIPTKPDDLAGMLECRLTNSEAISKMRYCTDVPAWTAEGRRQLGLPAESPIWPLKDNLLDRTKHSVDGLHRPYGYSSGKDGSLFTIHCEDANLISLNALYSGREKLWYAVARKDGYLVENAVKAGKCAQKVRHGSRWVPQSKLKAMGASFVTFAQRSREVVVVWGDIYHQGGTVGPAIAEAVNYGGPNWSIDGYSECSRTCPGYPIPNALLEFRAPNEPQREQGDELQQEVHDSAQSPGRERLPRNRLPAPTRDGKAIESELRMNKQEARPRKRRSDLPIQEHSGKKTAIQTMHNSADTIMTGIEICNDLVSRMVAAIRSRDAIRQFFDIVHGRRDPEPTAIRINFTTNASTGKRRIQDPAQMLENDMRIISMLSRKTIFHDFLDSVVRSPSCRSCRRDEAGPFKEFGFSSTSWLNLDEGEFASFRSRLKNEYTSAPCVAGRAFEHSLDPAADEVDFMWENLSVPLDKMSDGEWLSILEPFPATDENIYNPDAYPDWPRPEEWPNDSPWPVDPTSVPPSGGIQCNVCHQSNCPCDLCHERDCQCAVIRHETPPRIRNYEDKYGAQNRGLQAVAKEAGQIAYSKGTIIAFLTGALAPPDTYDNGQCIQVDRGDILGEPTVAQINCAELGNISRLFNHSCDPMARFKGMRVSGKFRIAIVAEKNIYDAEEITVHYGQQYWRGEKCRCPVCRSGR